jgi:glycosyltransferase involved in cell wall biosynthesis
MGEELGIAERLRFVATVPHDDLLRHTTTADVGVVPFQRTSMNNYLATPNKIFEYLMAGVPIAVSAFPEMTRIVQEHRVGAVFEPADPDDIARALRTVLDDSERAAMRERAWTLARTRFSWEHESRTLLEIYRSLSPVAATAG